MKRSANWFEWVEFEPKNQQDIITKIENDGYTHVHYDRFLKRPVWEVSLPTLRKDCQRLGIDLSCVWPLQTRLEV